MAKQSDGQTNSNRQSFEWSDLIMEEKRGEGTERQMNRQNEQDNRQ